MLKIHIYTYSFLAKIINPSKYKFAHVCMCMHKRPYETCIVDLGITDKNMWLVGSSIDCT